MEIITMPQIGMGNGKKEGGMKWKESI